MIPSLGTEKNLPDAIKHNKFLKSYWSDYAIKQGGAAGWTAMEEHEKIKSFLQDLRDKVKPSQFLSLAEKEFDSIGAGGARHHRIVLDAGAERLHDHRVEEHGGLRGGRCL